MTGHDLIQVMNEHYPEDTAYDWDNVGLQVGSAHCDVHGILLTLDVTMEVIDEAIQHQTNWIVSHHPLLFHPLTKLDMSSHMGQMIERLIKHDINVYSAHTNFDIAPDGLNVNLANILNLSNQRMLDPIDEQRGLGIIGDLSNPILIDDYLPRLKQLFRIDHLRMIGTTDHPISTVAISGGSGSSVISLAREQGVDLLITGDVTYHHALDVVNHGFLVLDVGHNVERLALPGLKTILQSSGIDVPIHLSNLDTDPYQSK